LRSTGCSRSLNVVRTTPAASSIVMLASLMPGR